MTEASDTVSERQACAHALTHWLTEARHLRQRATGEPVRAARRQALRAFQAARLARTHADLRHSPRYGRAAEFFLTDLYSPRDLGPLMTNTLPVSGLRALLLAAEVDAVSEQFDAAMVNALGQRLDAALADADYAAAYRAVGDAPGRQHQIDLILGTGQTLDRLAHKPGLAALLKMMRGPAQLAGLGELQSFLERGFTAFRSMDSARVFLDTIIERERALSRQLFGGGQSLELPPA